MTASALTIENIEVVYNHSVQALRGLSIDVPDGQIVALLGSNGAGKTSTLKAATGILPFEKGRLASGQIRFFGVDIAGREAYQLARQGMAHVREGRHVFGDMTVEENLVAAGNALIGRPRGSNGKNISFHARMYAPGGGIPEDPATGSATALLATQLLKAEKLTDGTHIWQLQQGYEMGRPSDLRLEADVKHAALTAVRVGGSAVRMMEGEIEL